MISKPSLVEIDVHQIPQRVLLDTGVLLRALRHKPSDSRSEVCAAILAAVLMQDRRSLVAAPSVAEILRGRAEDGAVPLPIPVTKNLIVVDFDRRAAELLAEAFPMDVITSYKRKDLITLDYIKYDAMIVACALRGKADAIIALDRPMRETFGSVIPMINPMSLVVPDPGPPKQEDLFMGKSP